MKNQVSDVTCWWMLASTCALVRDWKRHFTAIFPTLLQVCGRNLLLTLRQASEHNAVLWITCKVFLAF